MGEQGSPWYSNVLVIAGEPLHAQHREGRFPNDGIRQVS